MIPDYVLGLGDNVLIKSSMKYFSINNKQQGGRKFEVGGLILDKYNIL